MCDLFDDDGYSTELTSIGKDLKKILHRYAPESFIDLDVVKKVNEFIIDEYIDEGWYNYDRTYYYIYRAIKKHAYTPKFMSNYYTQGQIQKHVELMSFLDLVEWELKPALEAQRKKEYKYNKAFHGEDWVQEGVQDEEEVKPSTIQTNNSKKSGLLLPLDKELFHNNAQSLTFKDLIDRLQTCIEKDPSLASYIIYP